MTLGRLEIFCIYFEDETPMAHSIIVLMMERIPPPTLLLLLYTHTHTHTFSPQFISIPHAKYIYVITTCLKISAHDSNNSQSKISLAEKSQISSSKSNAAEMLRVHSGAEFPSTCVPMKLGSEISACQTQRWHRHSVTVRGRMSP